MINFFWWNTSLSHKDKQNLSDKDRVIVFQTIKNLIKTYSIDVFVLAEVRNDDIKDIYDNCDLKGYIIEYNFSSIGKTKFDICIILKDTIKLESKRIIHASKMSKTYKIAMRFDLSLSDNTLIHLFASHWQSKLQPDSVEKRNFNAHTLRNHIDELFKKYKEDTNYEPYIILMGDYNDEPFEESISYYLQSSRDDRLVEEKKELFFNPFWKNLCRQNDDDKHIGTCYYKSGDLTKWKTFDQIMYSHAFVKSSNWKYLNIDDRIFVNKELMDLILNTKSKLDHLPIYGIILKNM